MEMATVCGADEGATRRLVGVLVSLGVLSRRDGRISHTEVSVRYLRRESPDFLAGLEHSVHLWDSWSGLTDAIRRGGPQEPRFSRHEKPGRTRSFIAAMHHYSSGQAQEVVESLNLEGVNSVLDIGGGSGAYSIALVRALGQEGRATVFDLPSVVPLTREYVTDAGLTDRIDTVPGDYLMDSFPEGYDLALLSAVIHINSAAENEDLICRAARSLNPGGQLVVRDFFLDEDRCGPLMSTLFSINMLVNTERGDTYTESEMRRWFAAAGLVNVKRLDRGEGAGLMFGWRER